MHVLEFAYSLLYLYWVFFTDYKKYFSVNQKYIRPNEIKVMIGSNKNYNILSKKFNFKIKIGGKKLIKKSDMETRCLIEL